MPSRVRCLQRCVSRLPHALAATSVALLGFVSLTHAATTAPDPLTLYVSPDGRDAFSGLIVRNNRQRTDGPVATITHARDMVRMMKQNNGGKLTRPINIELRGGTYWLLEPFELTAEDSGTAEFPITYTAFEGERPVLSAGRAIRDWGKAKLNGYDVWAANVSQFKDAVSPFHELWVNGQRRTLARSPNKGYFLAGAVPDLKPKTPLGEGQTNFHFLNDDLKNWPGVADADVVLNSLWSESHLPVQSVDEKEHLVTFTKATVHKMAPEDRYFIEGAAELLDEPGEWYFDRKTATLYYFPMSGEAMLNTQVVIPLCTNVMLLEGKPDKGEFVEYVVFHGITFANSEWYVPRDKPQIQGMKPAGFNQAAWGVPGAIRGQGVRDCLFQDCIIAHAGNYGIELGIGCQRNKISYCTMTDLGAGGVKLGETKIRLADAEQTRQNEVSDCTIADCGKTFPSAIGIWLGQTGQNLISHNDIHGLWYSGISIGWTWGYGNSLPRDNIVEFNHVHHIGTPADGVEPILSDMGAIYTLGKQPGTIIRNNLFHDIAGLRYGGWGIYFDEGSSDVVAENNLVYRTTHGGFHQHYGENNIVRNNIFAFGRDSQIRRTRVEDHLSFTFEKNLVYWTTGTLLDGNWSKYNVAFDYNTYWQVGAQEDQRFPMKGTEQLKYFKLASDEWQKAGLDNHSQFRDPGFVDPEHNDFHLKDGAEKQLVGFVPFDVSTAGPRRVGH